MVGVTYLSFNDLCENEILGKDYLIIYEGNSLPTTAILVPHGGGIEPGTEELALEIHEPGEGLFIFSGLKKSGNSSLHVTSTKYDHPEALRLVRNSKLCIAIHGAKGKKPITYLGGLCEKGIKVIAEELRERGFNVSTNPPPEINGKSPQNIVNKNIRGKGIQLEISEGQRAMFFEGLHSRVLRQYKTQTFYEYARAIRSGIDRAKELIRCKE